MRGLIPYKLRLFLRLMLRMVRDIVSGDSKRFAVLKDQIKQFGHSFSISQPIMPSSTYENKVHNLELGISQINNVIIYPGQIFSFWKLVNKPVQRNGYRTSRNLISGMLQEDYGGGLCQLSGIIYHLSLITGLEIRERHHHSVDIYEEHERFTPLGADATIVFGYKDLRMKNISDFPIKINLSLLEQRLECVFSCPDKLHENRVEFVRTDMKDQTEVKTFYVTANKKTLKTSGVYMKKEV